MKGSIENLQLDAETFAEWGVDYLKFDGCYSNAVLMDLGYPLMSDYLNKTNRSIVYSCEWPLYQVVSHMKPDYKKISKYCNLWRNYYDVDDNFDSVYSIIDHYAKEQGELEKFQGPGAWNDPDMLTIGNFGLTIGQSKTQMAMWAIFSAPLIMSTDLRSIEPWAKEILQNKILITINQDPDGKFGKKFLETKEVEVWCKHSTNYSYTAFVMLNAAKNPTPTNVNVSLIDLGLVNYQYYNFYEAFSGEFIGTFNLRDSFNATVNPYGGSFVFWAEPTK
jgi:alpha-N-acetylgalactosaminidase